MLRRASLLVVVAGVAAMLLALCVTFVVRMRNDASENRLLIGEAQARIMLVAACQYVQESARIGWDRAWLTESLGPVLTDPTAVGPVHEEAFGWIDVRDGSTGPKDKDGVELFDPAALDPTGRPQWPAIGGVARCPMDVLERPPFALALTAVSNPISVDPTAADFGLPYLRQPDPQPALNDWARWRAGDRSLRSSGANFSWFRVQRETPARFIVTAGSGASRGWRDWPEVIAYGAWSEFGTSISTAEETFVQIVAAETRLWYRIEWSGFTSDTSYQWLLSNNNPDNYQLRPVNAAQEKQSQIQIRNAGGIIRFIERLPGPPAAGW